MSARLGLVVFLVAVVLSAAFLFSFLSGGGEADEVEVYVGVSFCGNTSAEARLLVDRVKDYTNLFVVLSGPVSYNEAALTEVCDYAVGAGLSVIVFFGDLNERVLELKGLEWRLQWIEMARERWGNKFLGVYYYDEPGGIYIDYEWNSSMLYPRNITLNDLTYDMIAEFYVRLFQLEGGLKFLKDYGVTSFVSDYALYWFDYLAGYDVVLAQVGWNHTFAQDIALVRGAARLQNKSWGIIVTWKYMHPPYLDAAENIYEQMIEAYRCGAKYIVIFNYAEDMSGAYGILSDEHFAMLKRFWRDVVKNPGVAHGSVRAEAALVLPRNYGWGMRHPGDRIWGWWGPDEKSPQIWELSRFLLEEYGLSLDIVYEDPRFPVDDRYGKIYYWNSTVLR